MMEESQQHLNREQQNVGTELDFKVSTKKGSERGRVLGVRPPFMEMEMFQILWLHKLHRAQKPDRYLNMLNRQLVG